MNDFNTVWFDSSRPMSVGLWLPINEKDLNGDTPHFADLARLGNAAKAAGVDALWVADHFVFERDGGELIGAWDVWTMMAGLAAACPGMHIGPMVACAGYRNPGVIAKMAEAIDDISNGRFLLGLGAGWNETEYTRFGIPFDHRVSRFEDAITIIHDLIRTGEADHQGTYEQANKAVNRPKGPRPKGCPIIVGSSGDRMLKSLVAYADGWDGISAGDIDNAPAKIAKVHDACRAAGRDPETVRILGGVNLAVGDDTGDIAIDDADAVLAMMQRMQELGCDHLKFGLSRKSEESIAKLGGIIARYDAVVNA